MCKIDMGFMTLRRITMERHEITDEQNAEYLQSLYEDEMKEILRRIEELELKERKEKEPPKEPPKEPKEDPKPTLQELRALRLAHFKP